MTPESPKEANAPDLFNKDKPHCAICGKPARHNVPRLGPDGGWIHQDGTHLCLLPAQQLACEAAQVATPTSPDHAKLAEECAREIDRIDGVSCKCEPHVIKKGLRPEVVAALITARVVEPLVRKRQAAQWACDAAILNQKEAVSRLTALTSERDTAKADYRAMRQAWEEVSAERDGLKAEVESLKTLWTEMRVVLAQSRNANCLASYGATQVDAVEAANKILNVMPQDVRSELAALRTALSSARSDEERLEWLENTGGQLTARAKQRERYDMGKFWEWIGWEISHDAKTVRGCIDQARAAAGSGENRK